MQTEVWALKESWHSAQRPGQERPERVPKAGHRAALPLGTRESGLDLTGVTSSCILNWEQMEPPD